MVLVGQAAYSLGVFMQGCYDTMIPKSEVLLSGHQNLDAVVTQRRAMLQ